MLLMGLAVVALSAIGYGLWVARFTGIAEGSKTNLAGAGAIGMAVLTILFMSEHFFVALQPTVNLLTLLPGLVCFAFLFRWRRSLELLTVAVMIWWAVEYSRTSWPSYDQGLYHWPSAMWNTVDSIIPGLANLHTRLGFNCSVFILGAGLQIPAFGGWALSFLGTALIEAMIAADLVLSLRSEQRMARLYSLLALIFLLLEPRWMLEPSYLSPDPVVAMGTLYAILLFLEKRIPAMLMWIPFLITVKLSSAPLILLLFWNQAYKKFRPAAAIGVIFLGIWVGRNVVLSGHLIFPVVQTKLPLPWAEREERTVDAAAWITSWARIPDRPLAATRGFGWIKQWTLNRIVEDRSRALPWMVLLGLVLLLWKRALHRVDWRLICTLALGILYWFVTAPDMRFATGFLFGFALVWLAYAAESIALFQLDAGNEGVMVFIFVAAMGLSAPRHGSPNWPELDQPAVKRVMTPSGVAIWTPAALDRCFGVIPCSGEPQTIEYYPKKAALRAP